jgi:hypothetical protein
MVCGGVALAAAVGCVDNARQATQARRPRFERQFVLDSFRKGNVHTHTSLSDGDSPPEVVAAWYRDHGYDFVVLTDHNRVTDESTARDLTTPRFVVLRGEEISMWHAGHQVHVNALCTHRTIGGADFPTAGQALQHGIAAVRAQGGVALINHPNFDWVVSVADVPSFAGASLIEVASGHAYVPSQGDATHPSHEALWDAALTAGQDIMGAAVDDMHHVQQCGDPPAYPGKGWVFVSVPALDADSICDALREGMMYSSTGPSIVRIEVRGDRYTVEPADGTARVTFVGDEGELSRENKTYRLQGRERWVRARVEAAGGTAWTPAVHVNRGNAGGVPSASRGL